MAESIQSLDQLSQLKTAAAPEAPKHEKKVDKFNRAYATGKRKDAVARVWIKPGAGKVTVNSREVEVYFARPVLRMILRQPLGCNTGCLRGFGVGQDDQFIDLAGLCKSAISG